MYEEKKRIEDILVKGLSHILKRTVELSPRDQLAIAQEYKEWINCISASDFAEQEILVLDKYEFLKIIKYVIQDANVFVISHKTDLHDTFDNVMKFEKVKGFSRLL